MFGIGGHDFTPTFHIIAVGSQTCSNDQPAFGRRLRMNRVIVGPLFVDERDGFGDFLLTLQIRQHIDTHPRLKRDAELLQRTPGIGELTAWNLLAELPGAPWADESVQFGPDRGGLRGLGSARTSQRQQRAQAHAIIQTGQHALEKSDVFSGSDRHHLESLGQSALPTNVRNCFVT